MRSGFYYRTDETHKWPHTRTLHLTKDDLKKLREWLIDKTNRRYYVSVRKTKRAKTEGIHSVVVYLDDPDAWTLFTLTWCW